MWKISNTSSVLSRTGWEWKKYYFLILMFRLLSKLSLLLLSLDLTHYHHHPSMCKNTWQWKQTRNRDWVHFFSVHQLGAYQTLVTVFRILRSGKPKYLAEKLKMKTPQGLHLFICQPNLTLLAFLLNCLFSGFQTWLLAYSL